MEQKQESAGWRELARHILTGLAVLSFVWLVRKLTNTCTDE